MTNELVSTHGKNRLIRKIMKAGNTTKKRNRRPRKRW